MNSDELIGQVGALYLKQSIAMDETDGTARFIIDRLSAQQTGAIAKAILNDPTLAPLVDIKLPAHWAQLLVRGQDQIKQVLKASVDPGEPEM